VLGKCVSVRKGSEGVEVKLPFQCNNDLLKGEFSSKLQAVKAQVKF